MRPGRSEGMACIVLAGGQSRRLGTEKAWEELGGESLLQRAVHRLVPLATEIIVVVAPGRREPLPPGQPGPNVTTVVDLHPGRGPLAGIYAGLSKARSSHSLVVACDMPFLNVRLLRHMMDVRGPHDVVIPRCGGLLEPLHAIYSKRCLGPIKAVLDEGENRIVAFLPGMDVRYVDEAEIGRFDKEHLSFFNVNTQADLERARSLLEGDGPGPGAQMRR